MADSVGNNPADQSQVEATKTAQPVAVGDKDRGQVDAHGGDKGRGKALKGLFWYGLARLVLFLAIFFVLLAVTYFVGVQIPAAITAVFALIIAMPLSVFVFPKLRVEANESVAAWSANRRAHKAYIAQQIKDREEN